MYLCIYQLVHFCIRLDKNMDNKWMYIQWHMYADGVKTSLLLAGRNLFNLSLRKEPALVCFACATGKGAYVCMGRQVDR